MTEMCFLIVLLSILFVLGPWMTNSLFINSAQLYSDLHKVALIVTASGALFEMNFLTVAWPFFCVFGLLMLIKRQPHRSISIIGIATLLPLVISVASSIWFFLGMIDLGLLAPSRESNFYAATTSGFLGWVILGCLVFLREKCQINRSFLWGGYFVLIVLAMAVFGIKSSPQIVAQGFLNMTIAISIFYLTIKLSSQTHRLKSKANAHGVVFFDGFCVLCNRSVDLLIRLDRGRKLRYASLQGNYAREVLEIQQIQTTASVVFRIDEKCYERAEAAILILRELGGVYWLLGRILSLLPFFLLNWVYDQVARNRYALFGKNETCLIPKESERDLFF